MILCCHMKTLVCSAWHQIWQILFRNYFIRRIFNIYIRPNVVHHCCSFEVAVLTYSVLRCASNNKSPMLCWLCAEEAFTAAFPLMGIQSQSGNFPLFWVETVMQLSHPAFRLSPTRLPPTGFQPITHKQLLGLKTLFEDCKFLLSVALWPERLHSPFAFACSLVHFTLLKSICSIGYGACAVFVPLWAAQAFQLRQLSLCGWMCVYLSFFPCGCTQDSAKCTATGECRCRESMRSGSLWVSGSVWLHTVEGCREALLSWLNVGAQS